MMRSNGEHLTALTQIRQHSFFSAIDDQLWTLLVPLMERFHYDQGERIISAGEESNDLFWLQSGEVSIFRDTPFGTQPIATLKEGTLLGELSLIDGRGRSTDAESKTDIEIWRIKGSKLLELFTEYPKLACYFYRHFWASLAHKINLANSQLHKFFASDKSTPIPSQKNQAPDRPAWFAPPEGFVSKSSSSFDAVSEAVSVGEEIKQAAFAQAGLLDSEIELLFQLGEEVACPKNEAVFHEGDFGDTLYFILSGQVRISKKIEGIGEEALAILEAGQFFGEMALVSDNAVRSADCFAHDGTANLLAFRLHMLNTLEGHTEHDYPFLKALCKMMANRLREINEKLFSWRMMTGGF